jgi:hypothetical protein
MYLLPENSKRRESVIAGLTSALVGIALIAVAGKASAMYEDASQATPSAMQASAEARRTTGEQAPNKTPREAANHAGHADHAAHGDHGAHQGHDNHEQHDKEPSNIDP